MKDYTLEKEEKKNYFKKVINNGDGTISVVLASGDVLDDIEYSKENIERIEKLQEEQADKALLHKGVFEDRLERSKKEFKIGLATGAVAGGCAYMISSIGSFSGSQLLLSIGAISVISSLPGGVKLIRNKGRVKELDKINYRNLNIHKLNNYNEYSNSLDGIDDDTRKLIERRDNPFSVLYVDDYQKDDLEKIVSNINKDKKLVYKNTKKY